MTKTEKSKRTFFKKVAVTLGFFSAAGYLGNLLFSRSNSIVAINDNNALEANNQKKAWLQKQWVPMTDIEKKQMLDKILDIHNKSET